MRNAALVLGIIAGIFGMVVGFFGYGYTAAVEHFGEVEGLAEQVENVEKLRLLAVLSPLLAIAGGAMARARALWGGILLLGSAAGMYAGFGLNVFTIFPLSFAAVGGLMALAAGKPDEPKAHF
ncbi:MULTISPECIES: hypothetical protein [unclassified Leisingera]|uniref:hypothetical protein n=1 Tax=unclassified Leisingera TaxID=2614906 RepID=UPI0002DF3595|nr:MULTISPECIES: hypothetical protein [unclassified Leisingera]KIC25649.1 hypothetical protein RA23_07305 [Leisingera sp. ANG-S3]KIC29363.1 hypothetical protein RA24_07095 [Leisingera sp. ANG-M6]KIC54247.1 hypothetical protein RA22_06240 [Leisingera sp. ANG-S]KID10932.1 hypothetical protein GC1_04515 [Leisingera sp. ANG1]UWQ77810.1 hypothetical protein K3725_10800 [Leisingera sp. S132]